MKTIKQIQEESRKIIILANNPEAKSYDEALEMELEHHHITRLDGKMFNYLNGEEIIGKPLTLSRVLISLKSKHLIISTAGYVCKRIGDSEYQNICYWDLTKETLEEQTEEAQRAINKLLKHD